MTACGLDFGTSNSAIGVALEAGPVLVPLEQERTLMPSAVFFDFERRGEVLFGSPGIAAYVAQVDGRLMRALKSILGSPLIDEETQLGKRRLPLRDVVALFVRHLKERAEAFAGRSLDRVVHGRPVRFVDGDDAADRRAQAVLEEIARTVGFREVSFVYEPIAAAHHYEQTIDREELVLVADIGGGTSDFSVVRLGPDRRARPERSGDVLSTAGLRVGGTDFDAQLSLARVMPLLGMASRLLDKNLPMPAALYHELAAWPTINFAYSARNERLVADLMRQSREPAKVGRLLHVLRGRHGHAIALGVEQAKMALSERAAAAIDLACVETGLSVSVGRAGLDRAIARQVERVHRAACACLADAGVTGQAIDAVFLTGGSSRVPAVRAAIARAAPQVRLVTRSDLLSVGLGLTQIAAGTAE
ncbi:MAG: Hsp70 family protein [Reyranellaceae bacterium]